MRSARLTGTINTCRYSKRPGPKSLPLTFALCKSTLPPKKPATSSNKVVPQPKPAPFSPKPRNDASRLRKPNSTKDKPVHAQGKLGTSHGHVKRAVPDLDIARLLTEDMYDALTLGDLDRADRAHEEFTREYLEARENMHINKERFRRAMSAAIYFELKAFRHLIALGLMHFSRQSTEKAKNSIPPTSLSSRPGSVPSPKITPLSSPPFWVGFVGGLLQMCRRTVLSTRLGKAYLTTQFAQDMASESRLDRTIMVTFAVVIAMIIEYAVGSELGVKYWAISHFIVLLISLLP